MLTALHLSPARSHSQIRRRPERRRRREFRGLDNRWRCDRRRIRSDRFRNGLYDRFVGASGLGRSLPPHERGQACDQVRVRGQDFHFLKQLLVQTFHPWFRMQQQQLHRLRVLFGCRGRITFFLEQLGR